MDWKKLSKKRPLKVELSEVWAERLPLMVSLFLFAFGMGMIADGKKMYANQLKSSQRVDYRATLSPHK
jgi:hypothetical protein